MSSGVDEKTTSRRGFIAGAGAAAAGFALLQPGTAQAQTLPAIGTWPWPAAGLDPVQTAGASTTGLGGCAVVTFGLMVRALRAALPGSVWDTIPETLTSAFNGGGPYGSDCGGLQGPIFMMTLVGAPATLKQELYKWYCEFAFPSNEWDALYSFKNTVRTTSHSPLCHQSRSIWEGVFIRQVYPLTGVYDTSRCAKLPRDCAKKTVELINAFKLSGYQGSWTADPYYQSCFDCHTDLYANKLPGGIVGGRENCLNCHQIVGKHPASRRKGR